MKKSDAITKPALRQFASLWSLAWEPSREKEWTLEEKFKRAKKAGFQGIANSPHTETAVLCRKYGMDYLCNIDGNGKTYREKLEAAKAVNPVRINVQFCDHDTPPKQAVKEWLKMDALATKMGLNIDMEVHRDTCTETPEKVYEIAALFKKATGRTMRFCWDHSHFGVVKHLSPPYADRLLTHPDLIQMARQTHFRPFNGHHCQIPATDGKGHETLEIKPYFEFVDAFFACWLRGAKGGEVLYACPEYGMREGVYGLYCFPNVWKDTIYVHGKIDELWKKNLLKWRN